MLLVSLLVMGVVGGLTFGLTLYSAEKRMLGKKK
jgi:hypothetical protein